MRTPPEPADTEIVPPVMPPQAAVATARQVVLRLEAPGANETLDRALASVNATAPRRIASNVDEPLGDIIVVDLPEDQDPKAAAETLATVPGVRDASPHGIFTITELPNDPLLLEQWGVLHIRAPQAWESTRGRPEVAVAVVDSGCDLSHPDLASCLGQGWNALSPDDPPQDDHGHGTHVAGIIAAIGNNGVDVAGVAFGSTILPVKALDNNGTSVGVSVARGIVWAAQHAQIINCSLGGGTDDVAMRAAVEYARSRGVLIVASMGNSGGDESRPSYPAAYAKTVDNVLAVGAVDRAHRRSVWSATASSNTGSWIGVVAPGTNINSLNPGGGTILRSGTSMACPHVTGIAALLRSRAPHLTHRQLITVLRDSAGALRDLVTDSVPNPSYGFGLVDATSALERLA